MTKALYTIIAVITTFVVTIVVHANSASTDVFYVAAAVATMGAFILAKPNFSEKEEK